MLSYSIGTHPDPGLKQVEKGFTLESGESDDNASRLWIESSLVSLEDIHFNDEYIEGGYSFQHRYMNVSNSNVEIQNMKIQWFILIKIIV